MNKKTDAILLNLVKLLESEISAKQSLVNIKLNSTKLVRQLSTELSAKQLIWLGKGTYVPNKVVGSIVDNCDQTAQELTGLFHSSGVIELLNQYILAKGYQLFDEIQFEFRVQKGTSEAATLKLVMEYPSVVEQ